VVPIASGRTARAGGIAGTPAELLKIETPTFLALIASTPDFALEVMQVMACRLRVMNRRYRHDHRRTERLVRWPSLTPPSGCCRG
jgi:CRP-like cAMP-binding protein